jgi:S-DNA-T family DNA segregation ATPase FtsK/SpoIIIE
MTDRRLSRLNLVAGGLLLAGLLTALCVLSHDPADVCSRTVYPPRVAPANLLGYAGAWLAQRLADAFGAAVYLFLAAWFVVVLLLYQRHGRLGWTLRVFGWLLLIPCGAAIADRLRPDGGDVAGLGGFVGTWLTAWLQEKLAPPADTGALVAAAILAIVLALDFVLLPLVQGLRWLTGQVRPLLVTTAARHPQPAIERPALRVVGIANELEDDQDQDDADAIDDSDEDELEDEEEDDDDSDDEDEDEEQVGSPGSVPERANTIPIFHAHSPDTVDAAAFQAPRRNGSDVGGDSDRFADYELPPLAILEDPQVLSFEGQEQRLRDTATLLEKTFSDFSLNVRVVGINTGPVVTQYELALETGLRVQKVTRLADDLAINLRVPSVRVVAPIPGKNTVGVEVPNDQRAVVGLKEVLTAAAAKVAKSRVPILLGKDTEGRPLVHDLAEMPHLLIAGTTGTGKSVCLNSLILSILMTRRPDEVKMIMIDPKTVEMAEYARIPHLMHPVVTDMKKAEAILAWAVDKMEERYDLLRRARVRNVAGYNELSHDEILHRVQPADDEEKKQVPSHMPYIVIVVDELADLMMQMKKEVEAHIIRLAQKSRAAGIHLVLATQKPTVDVITGLIKSNLPARICFQVASRTDSRVVLDEMGADKLLGKGDMLFLPPGTSILVRAQGAFASNDEIARIVEFLECEPEYAEELVQLNTPAAGKGNFLEHLRSRDELYEQAVEVVVREGRGSVSLLQRALGIGYGKAARFIDYMAEDGIVGAYNGSQAREVLYSPEHWDDLRKAQ